MLFHNQLDFKKGVIHENRMTELWRGEISLHSIISYQSKDDSKL